MRSDHGSEEVLSKRALNRALLARQLLLQRSTLPAIDAIEHLGGLQSQAPNPPYIGLWTRLEDFRHDDLFSLIVDRQAVRIALMRSTIHLISARDCLALRPLIQPVVERGYKTNYGRFVAGLDLAEIAAAGRALVEEKPRTFSELGAQLQERWPDRDANALAQTVRTYVPLVQVPPRGLWGKSGAATHTSAEHWLGRPLETEPDPAHMVKRYLVAFGPATVSDIQTWSGLTGLRAVLDRMRPELRTFRDERGRELFDLPDASRPDPDLPVPIRFLPEYDNALLSHADRTRIIADEHRSRVFTVNGIIKGTVLIDGFVAATWQIVRARDAATLVIDPFIELSPSDRTAIAEEGERLLDFAAEESVKRDVQLRDAD
jgi:hypothetical protein